MKKWINRVISNLVILWCQNQLDEIRKQNPTYSIFYIEGTEKDDPKYLMYTDKSRVKTEMEKI